MNPDASVLAALVPTAAAVYRLACEHGDRFHPLCSAFIAELEAGEGRGEEFLTDVYEVINERRAEKGLPPIEPPANVR